MTRIVSDDEWLAARLELLGRETPRIGEEMPGLSVFRKQDDEIYHTYSTCSRGLVPFNTAYQLPDLTSKGRDEDQLQYTMEWLKRRDEC